MPDPDFIPFGCDTCDKPLDFELTMAFQPIVDVDAGEVFAYEALARGTSGQGVGNLFAQLTDETRYAFDQKCRVRAVELAAKLGVDSRVSINFMPNAVYEPKHCIQTTLRAAERTGFPLTSIVFEVTEGERVADRDHLRNILTEYKKQGFLTAIDDFGAGYAGLNLLAEFQPDIIKLDMDLIRGIDADRVRLSIVRDIVGVCTDLGMKVIAEGIETEAEFVALYRLGIRLMQGYLIAKPALEALPPVSFAQLEKIKRAA